MRKIIEWLRRARGSLNRGASVAWRFIAKNVTLNEVHAYAGVALLAYGGNALAPGAGWAAAGAVLLWLGVRR